MHCTLYFKDNFQKNGPKLAHRAQTHKNTGFDILSRPYSSLLFSNRLFFAQQYYIISKMFNGNIFLYKITR